MATTTSPPAIRAVIIDGPETGQIINLDGQNHSAAGVSPSVADLVTSIEGRVSRLNLKTQNLLAELRQINAHLKESDS